MSEAKAKPLQLKPVPGSKQTPEQFETEELSKEQYKGIKLSDILDESKDEWNSEDKTVTVDTKAVRESEEFKSMMEKGEEGDGNGKAEPKDATTEQGSATTEEKEKDAVKPIDVNLEVDKEETIEAVKLEEQPATLTESGVSLPNVDYNFSTTSVTNSVDVTLSGPFLMVNKAPNADLINGSPRPDEQFKQKYFEYYSFMQQWRRPNTIQPLKRTESDYNALDLHNVSHMMSTAQKLAIDELEVATTRINGMATLAIAQTPRNIVDPIGQTNHMIIDAYNGSALNPKTYRDEQFNTAKGANKHQKAMHENLANRRLTLGFGLESRLMGLSSAGHEVYTHTLFADPYRVGLMIGNLTCYEYFFLSPRQFFALPVLSPTLIGMLHPRVGSTEKDTVSDNELELLKYPRFMFDEDPLCGYYYGTSAHVDMKTDKYMRSFYNFSLTAAGSAFASITAGQMIMPALRATVNKVSDEVPALLYSIASSSAKGYAQELGRFLVGGFGRRLQIDFHAPEADKAALLRPLSCMAHLCLLDLKLVDMACKVGLISGILEPFVANESQVQMGAAQPPAGVGRASIAFAIVNGNANTIAAIEQLIRQNLRPDMSNRGGQRNFGQPRAVSQMLARIVFQILSPQTAVTYTRQLGAPALYNFDIRGNLAPYAPQALAPLQNLRDIFLFGTQDINVEMYKTEAANQRAPLVAYLALLNRKNSVGDIQTVTEALLNDGLAHARSNLIFSKLVIKGSENAECIPWRQRAAPYGNELDTIKLPFTGALAYMLYGIDTAVPIVDMMDGQSIYTRISDTPYPSLFPAYLFFERAAATTVYTHFTNVGRRINYNYVGIKQHDLVDLTLRLIRIYYKKEATDAEERITEMFKFPTIFFRPADIVNFVLPAALKRPNAWVTDRHRKTLIHAKRPYGNMPMKLSEDVADHGVLHIPVGNIDITDYQRGANNTANNLELYPSINYFEEAHKIDSELLSTVFIKVTSPIDPIRFYDVNRKGHIVYMAYDEAREGITVQNSIMIEDLLQAVTTLNTHDTTFSTESLQNIAKMYNRQQNQQKEYIIINKARITYKLIEDTSMRNELVKPLDISVELKDTQAERIYNVTEVPIYYKTIINENALEQELTLAMGGMDGLVSSRNYGLSVYVGVFYKEFKAKVANLDGRRMDSRHAFNFEYNGEPVAKSFIPGNRVTTNNGLTLSVPLQIATRVQEEFKTTTKLEFRS
uniref:Uncharacterized protein n=1 Tax=viral metagenome TaxID=1070528 RepID=A0A2V0RBT6_9ZZZZ